MHTERPRLPDLSVLFPFAAWLRHPLLKAWTTWVFVALVAVPPTALALFRQSPGWAGQAVTFAVYFAAAWFLVLWVVVRPQQINGGLLAQAVLLALAVEAIGAFLLLSMPLVDPRNPLSSVVGIGLPEELVKAAPIALLVLIHQRRTLSPRDVLFIGALSGLVFGAMEASLYALSQDYSTTGDAITMVWRFVTDPISHACWAGIAGYFVGLASRYREPGPILALGGVGLGVPAVLHGINDTVAGGFWWVVVTVVSALLFLAYARIGIVGRPAAAPQPVAPVFGAAPPVAVPYAADPPTAPISLPTAAMRR